MVFVIVIILILLTLAWNYAFEDSVTIEHFHGEVIEKKKIEHPGQMMYFYRHGYLHDPEFTYSYEIPQTALVTTAPHHPIIKSYQPHVYDQLSHNEQVVVEIKKTERLNKISKRIRTKHHPVSILKKDGTKIQL